MPCSQILAHPFLTGLVDGSLPEESFKFYIVQASGASDVGCMVMTCIYASAAASSGLSLSSV